MLALRHYSTMLKPKHCEEYFFGRLVAESYEFAGLRNAAIRRFLDHTMKGVAANREPGSYYTCVRVSYLCSMSHTICLEALAGSILPACRCSFRKKLISRGPADKKRDQEIGFMKIYWKLPFCPAILRLCSGANANDLLSNSWCQ